MFHQFTTARIKMDVETFWGNKHDYICKFVPVETCYGLVDNFSTEKGFISIRANLSILS